MSMDDRRITEIDLDSVIDRLLQGACFSPAVTGSGPVPRHYVRLNHMGTTVRSKFMPHPR
jgi:hypothetical protein